MAGQSIPAKPQQIMAKACDRCRRKRIRCEPSKEGCVQCTKYQVHCHFSPIWAKKKSRRPAGFKYIAGLEERLEKMEGLLTRTLHTNGHKGSDSLLEYSQFGVLDLGTIGTTPTYCELKGPWLESPGRETGLVEEILTTPLALSAQIGESNTSSGKTTPLHEPLTFSSHSSPSLKGTLALGTFSLPPFHMLPTKPVALELVKDAFSSFNYFFPLFHEQNFLEEFQESYSNSSPSNPGWWVSINVVLAFAHRFRAMRNFETTYENSEACGYLRNGLAVVSELNLLHNSLPAVQGLVGMALILQGTPNPHASSALLATAMRLAQGMGLHRSTLHPGLTDEQNEQRRRIFWVAYFLDKDISLRMGQPFAQDDDDMDINLPTRNPSIQPPFSGNPNFNFFNSRIGLAVIQGQVYKRLYSVQATRQSRAQKAAVAQELDSLLSYWRNSTTIDSEPLWETPLQSPLMVQVIHMLILYFTYVNCLVTIHRYLPPTVQDSLDVTRDLERAFITSNSIGVVEARRAASLIQIAPHGDYACVWILLHSFFATVTFLLENVLRYPNSSQARSDLQVAEPFLQLLETLAREEAVCSRSEEARKMRQFYNDLNYKASQAVERASLRITFD